MAPRRGVESVFGAGGEMADGVVRNKAGRQEEEAGRAGSQSVSALCSESEEMALLKDPASTSLIKQKWKKG